MFSLHKSISTLTSLSLQKDTDAAFAYAGFKIWGKKKAVEKFTYHTKGNSHKLAIRTHCQEANPINSQLSSTLAASQQKARSCLMKIMQFIPLTNTLASGLITS